MSPEPPSAASEAGRVRRSRLAPILSWLLFVRFPLLVALLVVLLPFLATGPLSALLGNLFLLELGGLFGVTLLALLTGKALVLAANTASCSGPIRLLPARMERGGVEDRPIAEQREIGYALGWNPDGAVARALARFQELIAVALALPTIVTAFAASCEPGAFPANAAAAWPLWKGIAVGLAVVAYLLLRGATKLVESWFANPDPADSSPSPQPRTRLGRIALATPPPRLARRFRRLAVRFLLLPSFRVGYVRERSADEAFGEYARRREAGETDEKIRAIDDPTLRYDLLPGHGAAIAFFGLIFLGYLALGVVNYPGWVEPWFPTLGYVLVLFMGVGWGLASLSFWLDRYRVPVLLLIGLVSVATTRLGGGDHYFQLIEPPKEGVPASSAALEATPAAVLAASTPLENPGSPDERVLFEQVRERCDRPILAVAAAGGGITSAAWSAAMLTRLAQSESGGAFLDSLRVVSAVSGGSVGSMYFLDGIADPSGREAGAPLPAATGARIRRRAAAPSLDSVGWGLAYPDFARLLLSPLVDATSPTVDRSWALERSWEERLLAAARERGDKEPEAPTLRGWREATLAGRLPAAILNSTTVESGERFQMSTLRLTSGGGRSDFWEAYPGYDLAIATAARLSATFPFVSTSARARGCCGPVRPGAHFVDGGYYDNSGLLSALELLDRLLGALATDDACRPPIVLVRIEAFNEKATTLAQVEGASGWKSSAISPIQALVAVRTATQVYRNNWESGIFAQKWRGRGFEVHEVKLQLGGLGPLSWKLTAGEIARIERVAEDAMRSADALALLRILQGRPVETAPLEPIADAEARSEMGQEKAE